MAVNIYTIEELENIYLDNYATQLGVDVSELGDSYIVESKVAAGIVWPLYLKVSKVQNNIYPDLAELDVLKRYGFAIIDRYPASATYGEYYVTATGTGTVAAQTQFTANADTNASGQLYITDSDQVVTVSGTIKVRALEAGIGSVLMAGDKLTSIQPLVGINNEVVYSSTDVTPVEAEDIEDYRDDVLEGIRVLPQGGAPGDYRLWTLEIPEIRKVYAYLYTELGDLTIYTESTVENTEPGEVKGVPTEATLDAVYKAPSGGDPESGSVIYDALKDRGRKPITVNNIYSLPVVPITVDLVLTGLSDESISDSIRSSIDELLYDIRPFVAGAQSLRSKNDTLTVGMLIAAVIDVISGTGITYTTLAMEVAGVDVSTSQFVLGNFPYLRNITNDGTPI